LSIITFRLRFGRRDGSADTVCGAACGRRASTTTLTLSIIHDVSDY